MGLPDKLKKSAHAVYRTQYHLVWIPKYRKRLLTLAVQEQLVEILHGIAERYGFEMDTLSVQEDHVHRSSPFRLLYRLREL